MVDRHARCFPSSLLNVIWAGESERVHGWKWRYEDVNDEADLDTQDFACRRCQPSAAKRALVFAVCPQSTQSSHSYVPITPGHTNHSQEAVRTFWVSCQANEMRLSLCCQRTSSCSIHTASSDVWSLSQSQPSRRDAGSWVCVICVWLSLYRLLSVCCTCPFICKAVCFCGCSELVHHSGKDHCKLADGESVPRWVVHACVCWRMGICLSLAAIIKGLSAPWSLR